MAQTVQFSTIHGENVAIDKHFVKARWAPERSGSWMFASSPLEAGRDLHVTLDGSGHCDVGVVKTDPRDFDILTKPSMFKKLNGIQIHKMKCSIPVGLNKEGNEVKSVYNGQVYKKPVEKKASVWIAVYVKFGEVSTQLVEETTGKLRKFSENHGTNIRLDDSRRQALTINPNPATLCFVDATLKPRETIQLLCEPLIDGNRKPSRFHLKLFVSPKNPESYLTDFKSAFDTSLIPISDPPFTVIEVLEKAECNGMISVSLDESLLIKYVSATSKQNNQNLNFNPSSGVWVGFELFRVGVTLKDHTRQAARLERNSLVEDTHVEPKGVSKRQGFDVVDARIREPRNEDQEDSIVPFNSFVNRLQNTRREEPYISNEFNKGQVCRGDRLEQTYATTQALVHSNKTGHKGNMQKNTRNPAEYLYENMVPHGTNSTGQAGYVQKVRDKHVAFDLNREPYAENCHSQTEPKVVTIPKPMQIPIPDKLNQSTPLWSGSSTGYTGNIPSKTALIPSKTVPVPSTTALVTSPTALVTSPTSPRVESTNPMVTRDESVIDSRLSRIERTLTDIAEKVSINPGTNQTQSSQHPIARPEVANSKNCPIQKNWVSLVKDICADKLCDHLYQAGVIRDSEMQEIINTYKSEPQAANRKLLQLIQRRNVSSDSLIEIFKDAEQGGHLVDILKQ